MSIIVAAGFVGRVVLGMGYGILFVAYGYVLQRNSPAEMIGRVTATSGSLTMGIPLIAPIMGTLLADWLGLGPAYALLGLTALTTGAIVLLVRNHNTDSTPTT
jgi:MFS family permease